MKESDFKEIIKIFGFGEGGQERIQNEWRTVRKVWREKYLICDEKGNIGVHLYSCNCLPHHMHPLGSEFCRLCATNEVSKS